jgi:hypothetical protein
MEGARGGARQGASKRQLKGIVTVGKKNIDILLKYSCAVQYLDQQLIDRRCNMPIPLLIATLSMGVLLSNGPAQTERIPPVTPVSTKPLTKCPRHFSKHKDDHGGIWCMDSSGRNYTPENARSVSITTEKKSKPAN